MHVTCVAVSLDQLELKLHMPKASDNWQTMLQDIFGKVYQHTEETSEKCIKHLPYPLPLTNTLTLQSTPIQKMVSQHVNANNLKH